MKLLRSEFTNVERYDKKEFTIDFIAEKRVLVEESEDNIVSKINNNIYALNTLAFLGINAAGKTTTIKLISEMIKIFIKNESLDYDSDLKNYFNSYIEVTNYIYNDNILYKVQSKINKDMETERLYFQSEKIFKKTIRDNTSKKSLFNFERIEVSTDRSDVDSAFLKEEDSIFSSILNPFTKDDILIVRDLTNQTNFNFLSAYSNVIPASFINFLDNSIERFEVIIDEKSSKKEPTKFKIKFKGDSEEIISSLFNLENYLSSGTIRGVSLLTHISLVIKTGGYLLVDEFENHLNKTIVVNLIKLFNSSINKKSATLIFSTHYSEIIDSITRSDSIYILEKKKNIKVVKFSALIGKEDRKDKRKSDLILSGVFGTSPSYKAYMEVKKDFRSQMVTRSNDD